jgi:hypothetical protein
MPDMKLDHYEFSTVAVMAAFSMLCTLGLGVLIVLETVTPNNSTGIEGIVETFKAINSGLVGGLITMTRSNPMSGDPSATAPHQGQEKQP